MSVWVECEGVCVSVWGQVPLAHAPEVVPNLACHLFVE